MIYRNESWNTNQYKVGLRINIRAIFVILAKLLIIASWLCLPFLLWEFANLDHVAQGHFVKFKPFAILFLYVAMAYEFLRNRIPWA